MMNKLNKWFVKFKSNTNAKIRLFCFHHSGGGASSYYHWLDHISPRIELIAIQLPGREDRFSDPLINNMEDIIDALCDEFRHYSEKPFLVFGHSLGALIGFEFIKAVRKFYSVSPHHLIVSAARAPHLAHRREPLSQLDDKLLIGKLREYNGIHDRLINDIELLNIFLPIIRNDFYLLEKYQYKPSKPLSCNIIAFAGSQDKTVNREDIIAWSQYTEGQFKYMEFFGGHFFLKDHQTRILTIINKIV